MPRTTARATNRIPAPVTALATAAFALVYLLAVTTTAGQRLDDAVLLAAPHASRLLTAVSTAALARYHVLSYGAVVTATLLAGLVLRGPRRALAATATLGVVVASAEALKHGLPRPDLVSLAGPTDLLTNSFPSGHTAGAAGLTAAVAVLVPARWRPLVVAVGALVTAAVGVALVVAQWHRPSDVLGSVLLATAWGAVGMACADGLARPAARRAQALAPCPSNIASTTSRGTSSTRR